MFSVNQRYLKHTENVFCKSKISEAFEVKTEQEFLVPSNSKHITFHLA